MDRFYHALLSNHFEHDQQMAFLVGPRQVGKTTISQSYQDELVYTKYLNWDKTTDQKIFLAGYDSMVQGIPIDAIIHEKPLIIFDELHKYKQWKNILKGFYDEYKKKLQIIVTGSAKLNIFRKAGDSLMGRYFLYRIHPLTVAELLHPNLHDQEFTSPEKITETDLEALITFGGFPEPFLKQNQRFYNRWQLLRNEQLIQEDIFYTGRILELSQLELLANLLKYQSGQLTSYSQLAKKVGVSNPTIRRWISMLENFYFCYMIRPWSSNITRSLLKEPKIYLWDWSQVEDKGSRLENFVAGHLLKAVHGWTDMGFGKYELFFLRDKEQREVDFLITRNKKPWILLEVKSSGRESLSNHLHYFQKQLHAEYVFQLAYDLPYMDIDCFELKTPKVVPLSTFLSQLL